MSSKEVQALLSLIEQDWDLFAETAAHRWMGWSAGEAGRVTAEGFRNAVTPQGARAILQALSATDVTDDVGRVTTPTLVLHRRDDPHIPIEVSQSLAMSLARGRLVVLARRAAPPVCGRSRGRRDDAAGLLPPRD